jgi:hypothetical protein
MRSVEDKVAPTGRRSKNIADTVKVMATSPSYQLPLLALFFVISLEKRIREMLGNISSKNGR